MLNHDFDRGFIKFRQIVRSDDANDGNDEWRE
jgi:hypothetical protein